MDTGIYQVDVSLMAKFNQLLSVIMDRVFNFESALKSQGFGSEFTRAFAPELFSNNRTFASSSICEAYFLAG